jgi:hypothetical protein
MERGESEGRVILTNVLPELASISACGCEKLLKAFGRWR